MEKNIDVVDLLEQTHSLRLFEESEIKDEKAVNKVFKKENKKKLPIVLLKFSS